MTTPGRKRRISRKERIARTAIGMPAHHPELVTRKPGRAEWKQLAAWCAQLWPTTSTAPPSPTPGGRTSNNRRQRHDRRDWLPASPSQRACC